MKRRLPTAEEKKLWKLVTRGVKPLADDGSRMADDEVGVSSISILETSSAILSSAIRDPSSLHPGNYANIDRNTAERFRKGDYPIDATLDLHGMTRDKAHRALVAFIESHYGRGSRCLLVITGKGRKDMQEDSGRGILREMLPAWLETPDLRPRILAFDAAKQKHGGAGACYILLKRKR